jgi:hypothetical protein
MALCIWVDGTCRRILMPFLTYELLLLVYVTMRYHITQDLNYCPYLFASFSKNFADKVVFVSIQTIAMFWFVLIFFFFVGYVL